MSVYTGRRWIDPLNKKIGRRTGKDIRAGKNIRVDENGFENFDDYFSESDAELTRDFTRQPVIKEESESAGTQESADECKDNQSSQPNVVSQNATCNIFQSSQTLSQGDASNRSKFGWLKDRNIGRRTGKNLTANKQIRIDENGFENFDDYFSESDMSSLSSRLSVSVVKPCPRRGSIINSPHKEDGTQSLTSQDSQHTDELQSSESSQEEGGNTQTDLQEQNNTSVEEKTFTSKTVQSSNHSHSSRSLSDYDDLTDEEEKDAAKNIREATNTTNTKQLSRNQTFTHDHIDTPLSSRSSRSYSKVARDRFSNSNISYNESTVRTLEKNDSSRHTLTNYNDSDISKGKCKVSVEVNELKSVEDFTNSERYEDISQRNGKMSIGIIESVQKSQSKSNKKQKSNISTNIISSKISVHSNESSGKSGLKSSEKTKDSYTSDENSDTESELENSEADETEESKNESYIESKDLDVSEGVEDNETENHDDQWSENEVPDETYNAEHLDDEESDEKMVEEETTGETKAELTRIAEMTKCEQKEQFVNRGGKRLEKTCKSFSKNDTQKNMVKESKNSLEKDNDNEDHRDGDDYDENDGDDNEEGEDEMLRPSQAPSNIDVAGNRSGSITKLDMPTSVVSFNRTRKRLSYSASEASAKSMERNKSRIEKANAELFDRDISKSSTVRSHIEPSVHTHTDVSLNELKNKKAEKEDRLEENKVISEENSDFVCLTSRSTLAHTTAYPSYDGYDDDDDDIIILDYKKTKQTSRKERNLSTKDKSKKQSKKSDSESQSDSGNQTEARLVKKGANVKSRKDSKKSDSESHSKTEHGTKVKPLKKGSKSEIKVKKAKGGNKARRKTAHKLNNISDLENSPDMKGESDKTSGDNVIESSNIDDIVATNNDINSVIEDEAIKNIKNETQFYDVELKEGKKFPIKTNKSAVQKNSSLTKNKMKRKSKESTDKTTDNIESKTSSTENETQTGSGDDSVIQNRKYNRKTNKNKQQQADIKNSEVKKQKLSRKPKLKGTASTDHVDKSENNENDNNDDNSNEMSQKKKVKRSPKNSRSSSVKEDINVEQQNKKRSKRKSSSEDDEESQIEAKKTKKTKSDKKSQRKAKENMSDDKNMSQYGDNEIIDYSRNKTPTVDARLSMPSTNFGSGVSFRVSRRSELLEDVRSGFIGKVNVEMEQTQGLTPCISRPGARKSKGRRVTICMKGNIEHSLNSDSPSINTTPLPNFDSTPVHICETTNSTTPCADNVDSVIEDRLIKPSPPEEGLRRSQRTRLKPIEWYKNEQVVFDYRRRSGPAIIGVKPSREIKYKKIEEEKSKRIKLKYQIRKACQQRKDKPSRKLSIHRPIPPEIQVADTSDLEITIYNQELETEDGIVCIGKHEAFKPVGPSHELPKKEDPYLITKLLNHPCMTAGSLAIRPNAEKPEQLVTADYIVFYIDHGKVLVKIHNTTMLLESGDTFMVPIGNIYSISNLRNDTAKLFYTIHKEVENPDSHAGDIGDSRGNARRVSNGPEIS